MRELFKKTKGFTLIELLLAITIIGILATITLVSLRNARSRTRDARRISDLDTIRTALEMYHDDQKKYPRVATNCWLPIEPGATKCGGFSTDNFSQVIQPYLNPIPKDPINKEPYNKYGLRVENDNTFWLRARLENKRNANLGTWCYGVSSGDEIPVGTGPACN